MTSARPKPTRGFSPPPKYLVFNFAHDGGRRRPSNVDAINELLESRGGKEFDSTYGPSAYMPFGPSTYCPDRGRMVRPPEERSVSAEESGEASEDDSDESDDDAPGSEDSDDSSSVPEFLYAFSW